MFKKKFRVRVSHFAEAKYTVQWCHYRFIPFWHSLCFWFDQGHPGGTECWSTNMWTVTKAEDIASRLKTRDDVRDYYKFYEKKEKEWIEREKRFWEKNVPYSSKEF